MDIRNCQIKFQCPKTWQSLEGADTDDVKFCGECKKNVHYCHNEQDLMQAMQNDWCVAITLKPQPLDQYPLWDDMKLNPPVEDDDFFMGDMEYDPDFLDPKE